MPTALLQPEQLHSLRGAEVSLLLPQLCLRHFGRSSSPPGAQGRKTGGLMGADEPGTDVLREGMLAK